MKVYLGDGVYAENDEYLGLILTTENGIATTNCICIEHDVLEVLKIFIKNMEQQSD